MYCFSLLVLLNYLPQCSIFAWIASIPMRGPPCVIVTVLFIISMSTNRCILEVILTLTNPMLRPDTSPDWHTARPHSPHALLGIFEIKVMTDNLSSTHSSQQLWDLWCKPSTEINFCRTRSRRCNHVSHSTRSLCIRIRRGLFASLCIW